MLKRIAICIATSAVAAASIDGRSWYPTAEHQAADSTVRELGRFPRAVRQMSAVLLDSTPIAVGSVMSDEGVLRTWLLDSDGEPLLLPDSMLNPRLILDGSDVWIVWGQQSSTPHVTTRIYRARITDVGLAERAALLVSERPVNWHPDVDIQFPGHVLAALTSFPNRVVLVPAHPAMTAASEVVLKSMPLYATHSSIGDLTGVWVLVGNDSAPIVSQDISPTTVEREIVSIDSVGFAIHPRMVVNDGKVGVLWISGSFGSVLGSSWKYAEKDGPRWRLIAAHNGAAPIARIRSLFCGSLHVFVQQLDGKLISYVVESGSHHAMASDVGLLDVAANDSLAAIVWVDQDKPGAGRVVRYAVTNLLASSPGSVRADDVRIFPSSRRQPCKELLLAPR